MKKRNITILYWLTFSLILLVTLLVVKLMLFTEKHNTTNKIIEYNTSNKLQYYNNFQNNHYRHIFKQNENRNAAGFRFFKYIYDNAELSKNKEMFDTYNQFYCAVSGSLIQPHENNYDIIKILLNGTTNQYVTGKYYRCCTPCNCDITKYATVVRSTINIPKNSNKRYTVYLLTINDPCSVNKIFPKEIDPNVFMCSTVNNTRVIDKGYRVDSNNNITQGPGRLVIGVLQDVIQTNEYEEKANITYKNCETRFSTEKNKHTSGMGDIFINIAD